MLTLTAQYALRAIVTMASQKDNEPILAKDLAKITGIPRQYLSAILRSAVRARLLKSTRGRGGGYLLARSPKAISLLEVLSPFEGIADRDTCPFGFAKCSDENPCPVHPYWRPVTQAYRRMLSQTKLDVFVDQEQSAGKVRRKRYQGPPNSPR
ncbi:MAG: Rrf2 family transcriptional regulator [Phycisphaerae bacterium]|nr:Rrf2 family transcriptional regulator [Phycisphaerae bacterium]